MQTSGKAKLMVKRASIQSLAMSFLAIFKMAGGMVTSCALMLMEQGMKVRLLSYWFSFWSVFGLTVLFYRAIYRIKCSG